MHRTGLTGALVLLFMVGAFSSGMISPATSAEQGPVSKWKVGAWWTVQLRQQAAQKKLEKPGWQDAGKWRFTVTEKTSAGFTLDIKDLDRPEEASEWNIKLKLDPSGNLVDAKYQIGDEILDKEEALFLLPLKEFGFAIGKSVETLKEMKLMHKENVIMGFDVRSGKEEAFVKLMSENKKSHQMWREGDPWWRYYENREGAAVRATMVDASSWKQ